MRLNILTLLTATILFVANSTSIHAQGCVAIRQMGGCNSSSGSMLLAPGQWQLSTGYRYFKSFRHFRGKEEEPQRVEQGTEVINNSHGLDLALSYALSKRWTLTVAIPLVYNDRSSLYEHGRTERHHSQSYGLADSRLSAAYWLLDPQKNHSVNMSLGAGIKIPTGNYNATDFFYNVGPNNAGETRPVDQSIQPGDGGLGVTLEMQGFTQLFSSIGLYTNAFYLFNPRETNGTRTYRETLNPILANESIMSVPDQYMARLGLSWATPFKSLLITAGGRIEGVPVRDAIGGSEGFRRPGYVISAEPGVNWLRGNYGFSLSVPVALVRNRTQSITDQETEAATGQPRHGDAAFADYVINAGFVWRFGKGGVDPTPTKPSWKEAN